MNLTEKINDRLDQLSDMMKDGKVKEAARYSLLASGKRLRPKLMLTALKSYGLDEKPYIDLACAIEMIHTYSLIHDDLPCMDDDDLRRGRPTCHRAFDEASAVLAGDALLTEAFTILSRPHPLLSAKQQLTLVQLLSNASGQCGMVYGQQQDLYYENKTASLSELQNIHSYKTGCLITVPLQMASVIAKEADLPVWSEIGQKIGQAFQIQDDILDVIGDESKLGKKTGMDAAHHKSTYVSLLGLDKAKEEVERLYKETLEAIYGLTINHGLMIGILESLVHRDV